MRQDIRPIKAELRSRYKKLRMGLSPAAKDEMDLKILNRMMNLWQYRDSETILTYVSTAIEVDTRRLIEKSIEAGKKVAVPRCVPGTREMEFYLIHSLDELSAGTFGVLEPDPQKSALLEDFSEGLCIVPALAFDFQGYRLGYGKGYYDRFLARFGGSTVGMCYDSCMARSLPAGRYDRPVNLIVTQRKILPGAGGARRRPL